MTLAEMQNLINDMRSDLERFARDFDRYNNNILAFCDTLDEELDEMQKKIVGEK